ncbi:MAG: alpha-L-fucosidase [Sedimentisphaerales bacterium]|nr:alpha-L-fucosidase [Sedimentisphaerales bacterium]
MDWWRKARFGLFIHWGLFGFLEKEWDVVNIPTVEYSNLADKFNPVRFDPNQWVRRAKEAGVQYIVFTSKQHDGFCLFDSKYTDFDIVDATPFKRDVMKELAQVCHKQGMKIGWYHSILDWRHPDATEFPQKDTCCGRRFPEYVQNQLWPQCEELLQNYGPIAVMWFDGEWIKEWTEKQGKELYNHIRAIQPKTIINNRVGRGRQEKPGKHDTRKYVGDFGTPEQEIPATGILNYDWETCMTMNNSWNYNKNDNHWKSKEDLIRKLSDIVSKGGNFLLDVGPTPDGEFPAAAVERLKAIGDWLKINGESIYGTQASIFANQDWGRCTIKNGKVYLHVFHWPDNGILAIPALQNKIKRAYLLADKNGSNLNFTCDNSIITIELPQIPPNNINTVIVLKVEGLPKIASDKLTRLDNPDLLKLPCSFSVIGDTSMENNPVLFHSRLLLKSN